MDIKMQGPEYGKPTFGLAVFQFDCSVLKDQQVCYELKALSEAGKVLHTRKVPLASEFWLAVNTHLLGDGEIFLRFEIGAAGQAPIWSRDVEIIAQNGPGLAELARDSMRKHNTPVIFDEMVESQFFNYRDESLIPWFDRPNALEVLQRKRDMGLIDTDEVAPLEQFIRDGYAVLEYRLSAEALIDLNEALDWVIETKYQSYSYGSSQRIEQLHKHKHSVERLWRDPQVLKFLGKVFDAPALPCQTLTYVFGSQQDFHQDTIHLTPFPAGYMCGVWVALEDVREDSGELSIIPGSHRFPRVYRESVQCAPVRGNDWTEFGQKIVTHWDSLIKESGLQQLKYRPQKGSILVWHENLMHGGSRRQNPELSRRSIVSHYFAKGALAYYDTSALPGYMFS